jgi:hypothetical protein
VRAPARARAPAWIPPKSAAIFFSFAICSALFSGGAAGRGGACGALPGYPPAGGAPAGVKTCAGVGAGAGLSPMKPSAPHICLTPEVLRPLERGGGVSSTAGADGSGAAGGADITGSCARSYSSKRIVGWAGCLAAISAARFAAASRSAGR